MNGARPTFDDFLRRLRRLSNDEARQLAELSRVIDWRVDRHVTVAGILDIESIAQQEGSRTRAAIREATRIAGKNGAEAAKRRAAQALTDLSPSWPGMRFHPPLWLTMWAAIAAMVALAVLRPDTWDTATMLILSFGLALACGAGLAMHLLPPSSRGLRKVVDLAALGHVAPSLAGQDFSQLTGGWYAVLDSGWRRGRRPYRAWGCLVTSIIGLVLLGVVLEVTGAGR